MKVIVALISVLLTSNFAFAGEGHEHPVRPMPKEFDQLKTLVGKWTSVMKTEKGEEKNTVIYELTAGGNALVEKLGAGTPHEMVSIYHANPKSKVVMTHYCMVGNQPTMTLKKADDKSVSFEMVGIQGIASKKENHMHSVTITWLDKDHIKQEWQSMDKGKLQAPVVFELSRK